MIPGNAIGAWGMTVNTSQINFASQTGGGMFGYSGTPGSGNLYFAMSPNSGQDIYGNTYGAGITANGGTLQTISIVGGVMDSTTTLQGSTFTNGQILQPVVAGGTAVSLVHQFQNGNGQVLGYQVGSVSVTFPTNGLYLWTCPTGVTSARVQVWGAGAGGGGGSKTQGGEGGGGGEYAEEPSFPLTPGAVYSVYVGAGGQGGATGQAGDAGGLSVFSLAGGGAVQVQAAGGGAGASFLGGQGGTAGQPGGSTNTINFNGGNGGNGSGQLGGNGGGSSAGPTSQGNPGVQSSGVAGGTGGAAVPGGGLGGAGGNNDVNGGNGASPGGAGGGAGAGTTVAASKTYSPSAGTYSYYGADASPPYTPNKLRNHDGYMYQGVQGNQGIAVDTGHQFSYFTLPSAQIQSDLTGATVTSVIIQIKALYSVYGFGKTIYCIMGYSNAAAFGNTAPNDTRVNVMTFPCTVGQAKTQNVKLNGGIGIALQNGNCKAILIGPGSSAVKAPYWGYFDSGANFGFFPAIIVNYYTGQAVVQAGSGADGQVIITYTPPGPTLNLAIASQANVDGFGFSFQQGFSGPQLNLAAQSVTPTATAATAIIAASPAATPQMIMTSGLVGQIPAVQTDPNTFTVTGVAYAALSKPWTIPAGDAQNGTWYRLTCHGNGTSGNPAETLAVHISAFGQTVANFVLGQTLMSTAENFNWQLTGLIEVVTAGASGTIRSSLGGGFSAFGQNLLPTTGTQFSTWAAGQNTSTAVSTNSNQVIQLQAEWGANGATVPTITSFGSMLERLGP